MKAEAAQKEAGLDAKTIKMGMYQGDTQNGAIMVGQDLSLIKETKPVKQIIADVLQDTKNVLHSLQNVEL